MPYMFYFSCVQASLCGFISQNPRTEKDPHQL